jgi:outer membrane protein TolC
MDRVASLLARLRPVRRIAPGLLAAGLPLLGAGCASTGPSREAPAQACAAPAAQTAPPQAVPQPAVGQASYTAGEMAPAPLPREAPITLDAVLRIAEEHNPKIAQAREKLHESMMIEEASAKAWLPETYAGVAYYRHEGGIQDFQGNLVRSSTQALYPGLQIHSEIDVREATYRRLNAERETWQQKAQLSQVNSETLLEAATTYIDLLTAWRGAALLDDMVKYDDELLARVEALAKVQEGLAGIVAGVRAVRNDHQLLKSQLTHQACAASAQLVRLLGLPPETCLVPVDPVLAPVELVDGRAPCQKLLAQALSSGPGVRELEGVLGVIQEGLDRSQGLGNLMPSFQVNAMEGAFGAGAGASMTFENRLDVCLQMRWNLTQLFGAEGQRRLTRSRQAQAMYGYEDLKGKLAAGVKEAHDAIRAGRDQIGHSRDEIREADRSFKEGKKQLDVEVTPANSQSVLQAIRGLQQAHLHYLSSVSGHNKAQVRLLLLIGGGAAPTAGPGPACEP